MSEHTPSPERNGERKKFKTLAEVESYLASAVALIRESGWIVRVELSMIVPEPGGANVNHLVPLSQMAEAFPTHHVNPETMAANGDCIACPDCGGLARRHGNCYTCHDCGTNTGCS